MKEVWKKVRGYGGDYEISNYGKIRSYKRGGMILKPEITCHGYSVVGLTRDSKTTSYRLGRLVAKYFIGSPPRNKPYINHIDGNKINDCVSNLEYVSAKENTEHAMRIGLKPSIKGSKHFNSKLTDLDVREIKQLYKYSSIPRKRLAKLYSVSVSTICGIMKGKAWPHIQV